MKKTSYILGIESSCDDTAAAVLRDNVVLSNCIANQKIHQSYGGVVPELASRAHQANIVPVVQQALSIANIDKKELSAIAYTRGPGLLGSLLVGSAFAKSLALSLDIPLIEVNHMQAHLLCHFIKNEDQPAPEFPFLGVTLSGGHTQLVLVKSHFEMIEIGKTRDDAIGEAFDKCGKIMGLNYPAGPEIDRLAKEGKPDAFDFPIPKVDGLDVSYSGLKTAFINLVHKNSLKNPNFIDENLNDLCASIQKTLVTVITNKIILAKEKLRSQQRCHRRWSCRQLRNQKGFGTKSGTGSMESVFTSFSIHHRQCRHDRDCRISKTLEPTMGNNEPKR